MCSGMQQGLQSNRCNGIEDSVFYNKTNREHCQYMLRDCKHIHTLYLLQKKPLRRNARTIFLRDSFLKGATLAPSLHLTTH